MVEVEEILNYLQSIGILRLNKPAGDYYSVYCPFHNYGNEKHSSCGVLLHDIVRDGKITKSGFWHCFTCGAAYSMQDGIRKLVSLYDITNDQYEVLKSMVGELYTSNMVSDDLIPNDIMQQLNSKYAISYLKSILAPSISYVSEEELSSYRYTIKYMYDRGLTDDIIDRYDIGFDMNYIPPGRKHPVPCVTFPVRDHTGGTLFIARRSVEGKQFYLPQSIQKPVYGIYELPYGTSSVIVAESCFNALTAVKFGYPAVALFGTGTSYQVDQLRRLGVNEYILCLDGDEAGFNASLKLKKKLQDVGMVWIIRMPDGKDLNDFKDDKAGFLELYNNRE